IKPVPGAARYPDQVASLHLDHSEGTRAWPDVKQSPTVNDEAHFIFIVPVLAIELSQHRLQAWGLGFHINHIRRDIATMHLELVYFRAISRKDFFGRCVGFDSVRRLPPFVIDSDARQVCGNSCWVTQSPIFIRYPDDRHIFFLPARTQCTQTSTGGSPNGSVQLPPTRTPGSQGGALPDRDPHPKCRGHGPVTKIHEPLDVASASCRRPQPALPCPGRFQQWAATRDACATSRPAALSASRNLQSICRLGPREAQKLLCSR